MSRKRTRIMPFSCDETRGHGRTVLRFSFSFYWITYAKGVDNDHFKREYFQQWALSQELLIVVNKMRNTQWRLFASSERSKRKKKTTSNSKIYRPIVCEILFNFLLEKNLWKNVQRNRKNLTMRPFVYCHLGSFIGWRGLRNFPTFARRANRCILR